MGGSGAGAERSEGGKDIVEYLVAGSGAAVVSRTCIAPVERVKIIFQTTRSAQVGNWVGIIPRIWREEGPTAFWKGNYIAVVRVMPYLSVQLTSNEIYRAAIQDASNNMGVSVTPALRNLVAGGFAGATAVSATYPLDTIRARMALLQSQASPSASSTSIVGMFRRVYTEEGIAALYRGCWMSCVGGGVYCGIKFMTYDVMKGYFHRAMGVTSDTELRVWQRAFSGAVGGMIAQTVTYPVDVMRRRMQTAKGESPYRGLFHGIVTIGKEEGIYKGLYRGLSLNYIKTIPNVAIYLSLYDVFKYWLIGLRSGV